MPDDRTRTHRADCAGPTLLQRGEEATRQTAVNPTLRWTRWAGTAGTTSTKSTPEFEDAAAGRWTTAFNLADGDLVADRGEAHRHGSQQPRRSSCCDTPSELGAPLAVLTERSRVWWLYLPHGRARRSGATPVLRVSTSEGDRWSRSAAARSGASSTAMPQSAETPSLRHNASSSGRSATDKCARALPDAWQQVLGDPEGLLRDLLAETGPRTYRGTAPTRKQTLSEFLRGIAGGDNSELRRRDSRTPGGERH